MSLVTKLLFVGLTSLAGVCIVGIAMKTKAKVGGGFNISTALVLLLMLSVVVIALLTQMLYETKQSLSTKANENTDSIYCVPITIVPTMQASPTPTLMLVNPTLNPNFGQ